MVKYNMIYHLQPLLRQPEAFQGANTILIESTYADRLHPSPDNVLGRLKSYIEDIQIGRASCRERVYDHV